MRPARAALACLAASSLVAPCIVAETTEVRERVRVARVLVDVRVLDRHGDPVRGLRAEDFRLRVAGEPVRVTSVDWISSAASEQVDDVRIGAPEAAELPSTRREGRLIVLFVQRHLVPSRIVGLMKIVDEVQAFLDSLRPEDRVAIVLHDWSLELFSDFTSDHAALGRVIEESIVHYRPPAPASGGTNSSGPHLRLDPELAARASNPERALQVVGRALAELPGPKTMLYLGWGLGRLEGGSVVMRPEYRPALEQLIDARVVVYALDFTQADYHTLEGPMIHVAQETGGLYMKTWLAPEIAFETVSRAIEGLYQLAFLKPDLPPGRHRLKIRI